MKVFTITIQGKPNITAKDIQDYIWMNEEGEFTMTVTEFKGTNTSDKH